MLISLENGGSVWQFCERFFFINQCLVYPSIYQLLYIIHNTWLYHPVLICSVFFQEIIEATATTEPIPPPPPPTPRKMERSSTDGLKPMVFWAPLKRLLIKCDGGCLFVMCNISSIISLSYRLYDIYVLHGWHTTSSSMFILVLYIMFD